MNLYKKIKSKAKQLLNWRQYAVILMYHRIADIESSPYHGVVSIKHFEQQMEYLHKFSHPMPLLELSDAMEQKKIPSKSVIITFDDGYSDNYHNAFPILKKYQIPASIFITSNYVGSKREFWWDELERIFMLPEILPEKIPFMLGNLNLDLDFKRFSKEQRILLLHGMQEFLKTCRPAERFSILDELLYLNNLASEGRETYRPMTEEEIVALSNSGLIEIGAHTKTHPVLSTLNVKEQQSEIVESIRAVEKIINKSVHTFAYPFGSNQDVNADTFKIMQSTRIKMAVTTNTGLVNTNCDRLALPRMWVGDWDKKTFQQFVSPYIEGYG